MSSIPSDELPENKEIFHSSEYAKAAFGEALGSTSSLTYTERMRIDNNRVKVKGYRDSMIAREHEKRNRHRMESQLRKTTTVSPTDSLAKPVQKPQGGESSKTTPVPMKFKEPPSRGYDPYAR